MNQKQLKSHFIARLEAQFPKEEILSFYHILAEVHLQANRLQLALAPEQNISAANQNAFEEAIIRLQKNEPIQYIIGEAHFFGGVFKVNKNVLIPRPETEELVQWILDDFSTADKTMNVVIDIGTGSGCIAVSLAKSKCMKKVYALDVSANALQVALENATDNHVEIIPVHSDVLNMEHLPEKYDIMVSNPPYVRELEKAEMQPNVLEYEPTGALYVSDKDPLIFYKKIAVLTKLGLTKQGACYVECNQYLTAETQKIFEEQGFATELRKDIFGNKRMLRARFKN